LATTASSFKLVEAKMWAFSAARFGEEAACHFLRRERREEWARMLARTPRYGKLSLTAT
jgi:hypothetical protein